MNRARNDGHTHASGIPKDARSGRTIPLSQPFAGTAIGADIVGDVEHAQPRVNRVDHKK